MDGTTPCAGVGCRERGTCSHYEAMDGSDPGATRWFFCPLRVDGSRSLWEPKFHTYQLVPATERRVTA